MRIRFTQTRKVKAINGETFEAGKEYDLAEASAQRWIKRGVAVEVKAIEAPEMNKAIKAPKAKKSE